jgi:hypothetical protein
MILLLLLLCFLRLVFSQDGSDEIRPEQFGYAFIHTPERFSSDVLKILNNVVSEYYAFYRYTNTTATCPPPTIMDTPCDYIPESNAPEIGFFVSILLITIINLGILVFTIYKGMELLKTKINPFKIRVDPLTA